MAITNSYLNPGGHSRNMTTESNFSLGMQYTDNPLEEGYSKVLLNYALSDNGASLRPRSGLEHISYLTSVTTNSPLLIFATDTVLVENNLGTDAEMCRALFYGTYDNGFVLSGCKACIAYQGSYLQSTGVSSATNSFTGWTANSIKLNCTPMPSNLHGMPFVGKPTGTYTVVNGNMYVMASDSTHKALAQLVLRFNAQKTAFSIIVKEVTAESVNASKAVHNGYNMLSASPYTFTNAACTSSVPILDGIIPYKGSTIAINAKVGDELTFKLAYRYPTADITDKYMAQWEIRDIDTDSSRVLQRVRDSAEITPGDEISITTAQTAFKQFTLTCKLYKKSQVSTVTYVNDALDSVNLKAVATISLAYYYLTDSTGSNQSADYANYTLPTASGMTSYMQRVVLWGVNNAKNTLWISDINNPTYFPYPNNVQIFDDDIVTVIKWKTSLLVFTNSAIHQIDFSTDGTTLTDKIVQDRMNMAEGEACTVQAVQNMVFFKNENYYYMVVPASSQKVYNSGELTLAPVSRPITNLLDNFETEVSNVLGVTVGSSIYGYNVYLEGACVRCVYKLRIPNAAFATYSYLDFVLSYDTKLRTWSILTYESDTTDTVQYIKSITSDSIFAKPYQTAAGTWTIDLLQANPSVAVDDYSVVDYNNTTHAYSNIHDAEVTHKLDTGFRKLNDYNNLNKKWRQIQFNMNNIDQAELKFTTELNIDNEVRKVVEYETEEGDNNTVIVTPVFDIAESNTQLVADAVAWGIPAERFGDTPYARIKVNVNGKGRYARWIMTDTNDSMFELFAISYVYRLMTGR